MIHHRLIVTAFSIKENIWNEKRKLEAVLKIKALLEQIDYTAEIIPETDHNRLIKTLSALKGEPLDDTELLILNEITQY